MQFTRFPALILSLVVSFSAPASAWEEPARGTETRKALMDAIRPHADWALGAPIEFVVLELRRSGDLAFAMLEAQRPGCAAIIASQTPIVQREEAESWMDVEQVQVLYRKSGDTWVAVHFGFGATDAWWIW